MVMNVIEGDLRALRSGAIPDEVKAANRNAHMRMLDGMSLGLLVTRAAAEGITSEGFDTFAKKHIRSLLEQSRKHSKPIDERLAKAAGRYQFR